ncbi:MAG: glycosyltransferase [Saprospiraceae bacterium]
MNKFLYIGQQNKLFYQFYGIKSDKLIFTPYAVNNDFFNQQAITWKGKKELIKSQLRIPPESKVIVYSGKLIPKKNPVDLLNAFSNLKLKNKCFLIFMGDGELRLEMENLILEKSLTNVMITGFVNQSEISKYYSISDIYVMCSGVGETWGLSTNEAMNFGLPVLLSDMTGNADDLVKENGRVFRTNDTNDLLHQLSEMVSMSDEDFSIMGDKSKIIVGGYSYEIIEEGLHHIS